MKYNSKTYNKEEFLSVTEFRTATRILASLFENGPMSKTELALRCCTSNPTCIEYLNYLLSMGLVQTNLFEDGYVLVMITNKGRQACLRGFNYAEVI